MPAGRGRTAAEQPDALAAGQRQLADGEGQDQRAVALGLGRQMRAERHRGRQVRPEPDGMRRFPFALADIEMIGTCRAPPIDGGGAVALRVMAKLPEGFAGAGAAPAMNAVRDGLRNAAGLDEESGEALCQRVGRQLQILT